MQSGGYGAGVSEIQQFMVDGGCPSSLFSISTSPPNANSSAAAAAEIQKFHPLAPHPHHLQPPPPHFAHFGHPIPITQQLFQQTHHHHHPFQLFHHQHQQHQHQHQHQHHLGLGLEQEQTGQENSNSPGGPQSFLAAMNFKLGVDVSSGGGGGSRDELNEDDRILHGDEGSESRLHHHHHHHHHNPWHREEESAAVAGNIKEPFWRPLDIDFINPNNKRPAKEQQPTAAEINSSSVKHFKKSSNESLDHHSNHSKTAENAAVTDSNYKLFSELEAICKPGGTPSGGGGGGGGGNNTNQTGSGSALTGDDNPLMPAAAPGPAIQPDNVSDTSNGGDAPPPLPASKYSSGGRKKQSKRKQQKQLSSIATFFESLVKQLIDHQENLHRKFLEVMERRDLERSNREEAWRKQEAARANRDAAARAQERALAASREFAIIAFLEKVTGESLVLPTKAQFQAQFTEESKEQVDGGGNAEAYNALEPYNADSANNNNVQVMSSSRWPKAEVQALIRVRSGFETRFQEPGLKGPLWEEVSKEMAAMGYSRSAKRCKEKWENINKYFRKTKDSGKKRPQHSKTCPYFHQLDQLYSSTSNSKSAHMINSAAGTTNIATPPSSSNANNAQNEADQQRKDNSELLDAIVVSNEPGKRPAVEISNEDEDEMDDNEEGQGESQGDDDRQRHLQLCDDGGFHGLRS